MSNNYQQPQPAPQTPASRERRVKIIWITYGIVAVVLLSGGLFARLSLQVEQSERRQEVNSRVYYHADGGYAKTATETDPHLQRRLDDAKNIVDAIDENFEIEGYFNRTNLHDTYWNSYGLPKATEVTKIDSNREIYLSEKTPITLFEPFFEQLLEDQGYELEQTDELDEVGHIRYLATRNTPLEGSKASTQEEAITINIRVPDYEKNDYYTITFYDEIEGTYPLSGIPEWSGMVDLDKYKATYPWVYNSADEMLICEQDENSVSGYWDKRFECLQKEAH